MINLDQENSNNSSEDKSEDQLANLNKLNPDLQQEESKPEDKSKNQNWRQIQHSSKAQNILTIAQKSEPIIQKKNLSLVKQNKPRLIIDHMVMKNFKSYQGTQTIGTFHKNFTSIVGPNGSGKSNLIESMLFIFGFNASWMRLHKLNQLIHNSKQHTNVPNAAVQVHFKKILQSNDGIITQIRDSAFYIRRTVNTSSISKYYINGKESTQTQVKQKLKSEGIDLTNNRFLILQGEVQQISQMKQKSGDRDKPGFLEYLQDIIGSNQFIQKIEAAVLQYNQAEQKKHQKGQRMKLVQSELKGMTKGKQEAIKYVKKERRIFQIQSILQQVIRSNNAHQMQKIKVKVSQFETARERIIKEEKQKMMKQAQRVKQIKQNRVQIQKIQKQITKNQEYFDKLSSEDTNLKEQVKFKTIDIGKYEKKIQDLDSDLAKIIKQSQEIKQNLPEKKQKLKKQSKELDAMKQQLSKHDKVQLRDKIKDYQSQLKKLDLQYNTYKNKKTTLSNQVDKLTSNREEHAKKIIQYQAKLSKDKQIKAKIQIAHQNAKLNFQQFQKKIHQYQVLRDRLRNQLYRIDASMKQNITQIQQQGQYNNMFNQIMKAKIPGVIGRLGDLGTIPKQYDQIITTACGRLDNIVVSNYQAASKVIQELKNRQLGRATCIILDKISQQANYMKMPFNVPQNTVRLFDLITPQSQQAKIAFYYALSNTLYCERMDKALNISMGDDKNRKRVISKKPKGNGYIIYEMNGLFNNQGPKRGGFEKKATKQKKNQNQGQQLELRKKKEDLTKQLNLVNQKTQECRKKSKQIENHLQLMQSQKIGVEGSIKTSQFQIADLKKMIDKSKGKSQNIENYSNQIEQIQKKLQEIQNIKKQIQKKLKNVEDQQKKFQTKEISELREKFKKQKLQFTRLQKEVQKEEATLLSVQKRVNQNKKDKDKYQKLVDRLDADIKKLQQQTLNIQQKGMQMLKNKQAHQIKLKACRQRQNELKKSLDLDEKEVTESKKKIQQAKQNVDKAKQELRNSEQDFKFAQSQLQRFRKLYQQMTSTYDFLGDLQQIEKMNVNYDAINQSSMLQTSMFEQQSSGRQSSVNTQKTFPVDKIFKIDPFKDLTQDQLDPYLLYTDKLRSLANTEGASLKKMEGKNLQIISQFRTKFIDYKQKHAQFQAIKQRQISLKKQIDFLKDKRLQMFREGFSTINSKLKQVYQLLTNGGDAEMELIDSLDPFSDGINFSVRPPKKAWKQINKLSGGQKTLSSLSLIFALHYYKPTPLYFMDEIDAALDFKNVSIVADYIKKRTKDAQFIIISLRNNMFDLADKLIGVYKTFDRTKVINLAVAKILAKKTKQKQQGKENKNENKMQIQFQSRNQ